MLTGWGISMIDSREIPRSLTNRPMRAQQRLMVRDIGTSIQPRAAEEQQSLRAGSRQSRDSSLFVRWPHVVARRFATALVQAGSQIPAAGMFGHLVHIATLPGPWSPREALQGRGRVAHLRWTPARHRQSLASTS